MPARRVKVKFEQTHTIECSSHATVESVSLGQTDCDFIVREPKHHEVVKKVNRTFVYIDDPTRAHASEGFRFSQLKAELLTHIGPRVLLEEVPK